MQNTTTFIGIVSLFLLQGCLAVAPKTSPEEIAQQRRATLHMYEDNRVAVRMPYAVGDWENNELWAWNHNKDEALVYSTGSEYYNAKDVIQITRDAKFNVMTAFLKNGQERKFSSSDFAVLWCMNNDSPNPVMTGGYLPNMPVRSGMIQCSTTNSGSMQAIFETAFKLPLDRDPKFDIRLGSEARPKMIGDAIITLDDTGYTDLMKRVENLHALWSVEEPKLAAKRAQAAVEESNRVREARQNAESAGQVSCVTTSYSCRESSYSERTRLNCGAFTSSVGEMASDGWVATNVSAVFVKATLGAMCDHNVYHFHFTK